MYPPKETDKVVYFDDNTDAHKKQIELGLIGKTIKKEKETFLYKSKTGTYNCKAVGNIEKHTVVIRFDDGSEGCIHPSYLKDMQAKNFSLENKGEIE